MNKTTSINLGGAFFHIDEDAYNKLKNYFEAVKRSLDPVGRDEIINDIEVRIAEIFNEKLGAKQVVSLVEIDAVITVMGQPEDYKIEDTEYAEPKKESFNTNYSNTYNHTKKLFRDRENAKVGGVMAGLGHYLNVDALWLRIIILLLVFAGFGSGIVIYIVLWALVPEATSTTQKLEMKGQPINISNIERKVKEGFSSISDSINNINTDKISENVRYTTSQVGSTLGDVITTIFKAFGKVVGLFFVFIAGIVFISIVVSALVMLFGSIMPDNWGQEFIHTPFSYYIPYWLQAILLLTLIGIPVFAFMLVSTKMIFSSKKPMGQNTKYILLTTWILALLTTIFVGANFYNKVSHNGQQTKNETINLNPNDTLKVRFIKNEFFTKDKNYDTDYRITTDSLQNEIMYSNNVNLILKTTNKSKPYITIEKFAKGSSLEDANECASKIKFGYKIVNNEIIFNNFLTSEVKDQLRNQKIKIYLFLPEGTIYQPLGNTNNYTDDYDSDFNNYDSDDNKIFKVTNDQIKCLNCKVDETDEDENDQSDDYEAATEGIDVKNAVEVDEDNKDEDVTIKVNGKEFLKTTTTKNNNAETLKIELNGKELINSETKKTEKKN